MYIFLYVNFHTSIKGSVECGGRTGGRNRESFQAFYGGLLSLHLFKVYSRLDRFWRYEKPICLCVCLRDDCVVCVRLSEVEEHAMGTRALIEKNPKFHGKM